MRVLLDFTQIPLNRTGVGVYAENLVRRLDRELGSDDQLLLLVQKDEQALRDVAEKSPKIKLLRLPTQLLRNRLLLLLYEQTILPFLLWTKKIDLVHSLHYTHPLISPCPRVVTIHDLTFMLYPELHTRWRTLVMPFFIKQAVQKAEAVVFVSKATADDGARLIPAKRDNLRRVIPLAVEIHSFEVARTASDEVLKKFSIAAPYVLFLGTIEPRKNVLRLIQAFEQIAARQPKVLLVIAGKTGWDFADVFFAIRASKHAQRIHYLGFISELEKNALVNRCELLVYPSLYEGFGLPVLEAMAAGAPVITSNVSSLPEVAGDAAMLINPLSVEDIANAMSALLKQPAMRNDLALRGKQRAAQFNWSKVAKATYDLYKEVVQR